MEKDTIGGMQATDTACAGIQRPPRVNSAFGTMNSELHGVIRGAVMAAYKDRYNLGKQVDPFLAESIVGHVFDALDIEADNYADPRTVAFEAIECERAYQDAGFGNARNTEGRHMTPGEIVLCLDKLISDAKHIWYKPESNSKLAHVIRKIGGVAVQFMERYGTAPRAFTPAQERELEARGIL